MGPVVEYNVINDFYIQSGLIFSQKGLKFNSDNKISVYYLEIPISLMTKMEVNSVKIMYGVGPYFAYGIMSKLKQKGEDETVIEDVDLGYDHEEDTFISGDFGLNLNAGVEYSSLQVNIEFGLGLTDIAHRYPSMFNRRVGFTIAYLY